MSQSLEDDRRGRLPFAGQSEMHARVNGFSWHSTPLGSIDTWPQSLRATITLLLGSRYPMILLWGPQLIQIYNEAYIGLIGEKHPGALGRSIRETQAESWETIGPMIHEVMSTGVPNWVPAQCLPLERHGYREESYFSLSYSAVEDDTGHIAGMLCVCSEVTEQVLGERRLELLRDLAVKAGETSSVDASCAQMAEALASHALDVPFAALYLRSEDGSALALQRGFGLLPSALPDRIDLGESGAHLSPGGGRSDLLAALVGASHGETVSIDGLFVRFGVIGGPFLEPVDEALVIPLDSASQHGCLGVLLAGKGPNRALDATYRSFYQLLAGQVSAAIRNARAHEDERRRAELLAELDHAKTVFFSNISHEFRTPLTLLLAPIEHALESTPSGLSGEDLEAVHRSARRLLRLVNSLLDFSRLSAGRLRASFEPTDLAAFTADLASSFRSLMERAGLALVVDCPPLSAPVAVDRSQWEKIVLNLLSNAFKFTFAGQVSVALTERDGEVDLVVSDTGTGIPAHELPHIFERFHRVEGARGRSFEGTGIGLSLVHDLARLHSGRVSVISTEGVGSTFTVSIPMTAAERAAPWPAPEPAAMALPPEADSRGPAPAYLMEAEQWLATEPATSPPAQAAEPLADDADVAARSLPALADVGRDEQVRLLIADDNSDMRKYLTRLLGERWQVDAVADGALALARARERRPDLVLADVMMPNLDGFGLLRELRGDPATRAVPVILLSARAGEEAVVEGLDRGADDYLVKPFSARELFARVTTLLTLSRLRRVTAEAEERERSARKLRFLADASATLAESLDYRTTLARVAQLAVPILADWCFVDIVEDSGAIVRVQVAHANPEHAELAAQLAAHPAGASDNPNNPATRALFEGKSVLIPVLDREQLPGMSHGAAHLAVMHAVALESLMAVPLFARGRILGSLTFGSTSRERRYAEMDLALAEDLARRCALAVDNAKLYQSAQSAIAVRDHFLSIASHELRTPLTPMQLQLHTLERKVEQVARGPQAAAWLSGRFGMLRRQSERLERLVDELLDVTRIDAGRLAPDPQWLDLERLLREIFAGFDAAGELSRTGSRLELRAEQRVQGYWDRSSLEQVLTNLIDNALKFGRGKPIVVSLVMRANAVAIEIMDQGLGIAPADQARIFERFERAVSERSYGGLGLGLWVARRHLDAMGGRISVVSAPGRGATFSVELPMVGRRSLRAPRRAPAGEAPH